MVQTIVINQPSVEKENKWEHYNRMQIYECTWTLGLKGVNL